MLAITAPQLRRHQLGRTVSFARNPAQEGMAVTVAPAGSGESCPIPYVVLLTGLPAAGKTTVGRPLAARLRLPDIRSDTIKEAIFDSTDSRSPAWSDFLKLVSKQTG